MKKWIMLTLAVILTVTFSSCDVIQLYPEELMQPPVFSEEQREIYSALYESIGDEFLLQYPTGGENRSAIVLYDLDEDGSDEALVMYKESEDSNTRINVLSHNENGWRSVCDVAGYSGEVYEIDFAYISDTGELSVLVGFDQVTSSTNTMLVYGYEDGRLLPIYIRDYSAAAVLNIDGDESDELVVINNNFSSRRSYASVLWIENGEMVSGEEAPMNEDVFEYLSLTPGKMPDGRQALYIDSKLSSGSVITEILAYTDDTLTNFAYGYDSRLIEYSMRQNESVCEDIDGDGIVEIPVPITLTTDSISDNSVTLTAWQHFDGINMETVRTTADNLNYGYRFFMPEEWLVNYRVIVNDIISNNEWRFVGFSYEDMQYSETILSIRVYSSDEIIDMASLAGYTQFAENGNHAYYAYIPENVSEEYVITLEQLKEKFHFLK